MSFPAYESYKDSGIEWLGRVPSHWLVQRIKASVKDCRNGLWGEEPDGGDDDISVKLDQPTHRKVTKRERDDRLVQRGDLLLEKSGGGEKQPVGAVVLYDHATPAICSNFVARLRLSTDMYPSFWRYAHAAAYAVRLTVGSINQTSGIQNLDQSRYFDEFAAFPPWHEQRAIAAFLDRETAKIDALVEAQERLIALLKEKRQAVISHAVTKGLDPSVPIKDSGVEWLGQVPAHWEVRRLKHLSPAITVGIVVNPSNYVSDDGLPFIYGGDIREGKIDWANSRRIAPEISLTQPKTVLRTGDLLTVRVGAPGVTSVVPEECDGGNCASVMHIRRGDFSSDWLCFAMNSRPLRYQVEVVQYGAAQEQFNISHAIDFVVPTPPRNEAALIGRVLSEQTAALDALSEAAVAAITLLQERRAALISAAVTGKIDVRGLVQTAEAA